MAAGLTITVDSEEVTVKLKRAMNALDNLVLNAARQLAVDAAREGGNVNPVLGDRWNVDRGMFEAKVSAPEEAWWAHFIAGGTKQHGPRTAPRMVFELDGTIISATQVAGIPANPFDKRAVSRTRSRLDDIIRRML